MPGNGSGPEPRRPRFDRKGLRWVAGASGVALAIGIASIGFELGAVNAAAATAVGGEHQQSSATTATAKPADFQDISLAAQQAAPGLVDINADLGLQGAGSAGTGIVLTSDGKVLTNNHVVEGATDLSVTDIGTGQTYRATVLGYDRSEDVALLQLSGASDLPTAKIGNSGSVAVGDRVAGIGNAGGVGGAPSVSPGRVTALNQDITASDDAAGSAEQLHGLVQVAANIRPGDSGGALIDTAGEVIGMDTAASTGYRFQGLGSGGGVGFAIPIQQALSIAHDIETGQASGTVHIGPTALLGAAVSDGQGAGAVVRQVVAGTPAEQLGLAPGDVITTVNGRGIDSPTALTAAMDTSHPGDPVTVQWTDAYGQTRQGRASLIAGPVG
ncbi:S1C family serine protease [Nocardia acididurans]|uniref:S1C family serine protease n=1 Tax=Nocardia acididurans TaxID=2802282 RepID=UPI0035574986